MTNFRLTVPPLVRFSSVTSMCIPGFSPSVLAMAPAVGAAATGAGVGCGAGARAGATVATVAVVDVAWVAVGDGAAVSPFLHPKSTTIKRTTEEAIFLFFPPFLNFDQYR